MWNAEIFSDWDISPSYLPWVLNAGGRRWIPGFLQYAPAEGYCRERGNAAFHPLVTCRRAAGVPSFTIWLWVALAILEQTKAELQLRVGAPQIIVAFPSLPAVVTAMLGFKIKSSPTDDKWMHLYVSGKRLEENVGIARGKQLKFSAWGLPCSSHYTLHEGYDMWGELTLFTGHWQTFQILSLSTLLKALRQLFGSVTTICSPACLEGTTAAFFWHRY